MTKKLLFVTTILLAVGIVAFAADVTGKWTYETPGRNGGPARQTTITLKQDGAKLTGSIPGFRGGEPTEITNGKVDGDNVSFEVTREFNGNSMTTKYSGTVSGDEMKLTVERPGRDGNTMKNEYTAKRAGS
jgi:hypothetical protein